MSAWRPFGQPAVGGVYQSCRSVHHDSIKACSLAPEHCGGDQTVLSKGSAKRHSLRFGELQDIFPYRGMRIVRTENRDKTSRIVNGHDATVVFNQGNTILVRFPDDGLAFVYPVTHAEEGSNVTRYPFTPAYARTICKSQGQNLKHLIVWLDCERVPKGMAYVALSRVKKKANIWVSAAVAPLPHDACRLWQKMNAPPLTSLTSFNPVINLFCYLSFRCRSQKAPPGRSRRITTGTFRKVSY